MARAVETEEAAAAPAQITEPGEFPLTLEEFCSRLSTTDKRVELIGAFAHDETRAGRIKGLASEYEARFRAFVTKPA